MKLSRYRLLFLCYLSLLVSIFALTACTDKKPAQQRSLDDFEKRIIGTWRNSEDWGYDFKEDGTVICTSGLQFNFSHMGDSFVDMRHCEIIHFEGKGHKEYRDYVIFDDDPNTLYQILENQLTANSDPAKRQEHTT